MPRRVPLEIDVHIGQQLRAARHGRKLSQKAVADQVGITWQQLQKYESGGNRVSGSRLYNLARALNVSILFFYAGLPGYEDVPSPFPKIGARKRVQK